MEEGGVRHAIRRRRGGEVMRGRTHDLFLRLSIDDEEPAEENEGLFSLALPRVASTSTFLLTSTLIFMLSVLRSSSTFLEANSDCDSAVD